MRLPISVALVSLVVGCPATTLTQDSGATAEAGRPPDAPFTEDGGVPEDDMGSPSGDDAAPPDSAVGDAGISSDGGGGRVDAGRTDAGVPTASTPTTPPTVVRRGTAGLILRGTVLAPSGPISPGEVLIVGNLVQCVAADCSAAMGAAAATIIDTHGAAISPGLIDGHNHLAYNFLGEWVPNPLMLFDNRYVWANDPQYEAFVRPYTGPGRYQGTGNPCPVAGGCRDNRVRETHVCPPVKWAELRSLIHGTTTVHSQTPGNGNPCYAGLVRNSDTGQHGLGPDRVQSTIGSVRDVTDADRATLVAAFAAGTTNRYVVHMAEGVTRNSIDREFASYAGRDTRMTSLLSPASGMPYGTGVFIHAVAMSQAEITEAATARAKFVWSPSSNIVLYGRTADIAHILSTNATVGLGPDWTPSGSDEMLSEMRFAYGYGRTMSIPALTPERIWRMATADGAEVTGLAPQIGVLAAGARADVVVFGRMGPDPYQAVLDSRAADVRLVLIDGAGYYGDLIIEPETSVNAECDTIDACGEQKYLCVKNVVQTGTTTAVASRAAEDLDAIRVQLVNILEGTGYPADEQYGRGNELLPLIDCSL